MRRRVRTAVQETFRSLQVRNFRLFFTGQLVSQIGNWLTMIAQTLLVLELTDSGVAVGALAACQFGPVLLFGAWGGLVVDRCDKRRLLLTEQVIAMVQSFALAALAFMGDPPVWAIFAVAGVGGLTTAFDSPARRAFVVEMVPETDVQNAVSLNTAVMTSARIFGPALAGLLIATTGFGWCFLIDALSYVAVLWALWRIDPTEIRAAPAVVRGKGQVRAGLRYVRRIPALWVSLVIMTIVGTLAYNFNVVLPLFVTRTLHGEMWQFTVLYAVMSFGSLIGALWSARLRTIELRGVVWAVGSFGVAMTVIALAPTLNVAYLFAVGLGFTNTAFMSTCTALVQLRAEPVMRGRVLALQSMVFLGSTPIGGPIVGAIIDAFGARMGMLLGAISALGAAAWGWSVADRGVDDALEGSPGSPASEVLGEEVDAAIGGPVGVV